MNGSKITSSSMMTSLLSKGRVASLSRMALMLAISGVREPGTFFRRTSGRRSSTLGQSA